MHYKKTLFIDRDGTIISEPYENFQVDSISKLAFEPNVIHALLKLKNAGYQLIMVTNQDGLGSKDFPKSDFDEPHNLMMKILHSQGIKFNDVLICPHKKEDNCNCRKPKTEMLEKWLTKNTIHPHDSYVIGDRLTDLELAKNINIKSIHYSPKKENWNLIAKRLTNIDRYAIINRNSKETKIQVEVWLDREGKNIIFTGIPFFDHMLEQIAIHAHFRLKIHVKGDLEIDDHHTIEDTGLSLGKALLKALKNKRGIKRYGFVLPMDESLAQCALDISGRPYLSFKTKFKSHKLGQFNSDMIEHFFRSLSCGMMSTLHLKSKGKNDHHCAESLFKAFGCTLYQAKRIQGKILPSSKGVL